MSSTVPMDAREHGEVAAIRHALAAGWLSADAVREVSGSDEGDLLLRLTAAARLPDGALAELRRVAGEAEEAAARRGLARDAGPGRTVRVVQASLASPPPTANDPWADVPTREHDEVVPIPRAAPRRTADHVGVLTLPGEGVITLPGAQPAPSTASHTEAGGPPPSPEKSAARSSYGPYDVDSELARGGMGVVYRAHHRALGTPVALKVLLAGGAEAVEDRLRFEQEARTTAALVHPGIVAVRDYGVEAGAPWLAMDLVRGESLRAKVAREGPLEPKLAARLLAAVARAVAHAHGQGVLHRDLKPHNVLLDEAGAARLTDFGLARRVDVTGAGLTVTGQILGTPAYMPPEQAGVGVAEVRSDVYGLGATLYELLTGRPPFQGVTVLHVLTAVLGTEPLPPSKLRPGLDRDLETIVLCCLEKEPSRRYATAAALADDLERFLEHAPVRARPLTPARRAARWAWRRRRWLSWAAVLVTIVGGLTVAGARKEARDALERAESDARAVVKFELPGSDEARQRLLVEIVGLKHPRDPRFVPLVVAWGRLVVRERDSVEALPALDRALEARPGDPDALALRAHIRVVAGREGARDDVEAALAAGTCPPTALHDLGVALCSLGRFPEAQRLTEAGVRDHPRSALALLARAEARFFANDLEGSLADCRGALALGPSRDGWYMLGLVEGARRDFRAALAAFDEALRLAPDDVLARLRRADILLHSGQSRRAEEDADDLVERGVRRPDVFSLRGRARFARGDLQGAADDLRTRIELDPRDNAARVDLSQLELTRGRPDVALATLQEGLRRAPDDPELLARLVDLRVGERDLDAVEQVVVRLERIAPGRPHTHYARARVQLVRDDLRGAVRSAEQAIALDARVSESYLVLGVARMGLGDQRGAVASLQSAYALRPYDLRAAEGLAQVQVAGGDLAAAREVTDRAVKLPVAQATTWNLRGSVRAMQGDPRGAIEDFSRALALDPRLAAALANRAFARAEVATLEPDGWAEALADAEAGLALDPGRATCWIVLGQGRLAQGDLPAAAVALDAAVKALPADATARLLRAELRLRQGDRAGAAEDAAVVVEARLTLPLLPRLAAVRAALAGP